METPILVVEKLNLAYDKKPVIRNCSLSVNKGEILVILGASGAGKSTLLKAIAGLSPHQKGSIIFEGEKVVDANNKLIPGHDKIKLINQDFGLDEFHTVEENIRIRLLKYNKPYQDERLQKMLRLSGLNKYKNQKGKDLSGGQKQRLAIARALADEPELILLDEPFNQVDFKTKTRLTRHLRSYLKKTKTTMIMVTHNGQEAMEWADEIAFIKNGTITRKAEANAFYNVPQNKEEALFFGPINKLVVKDTTHYFRPGNWQATKNKKHHLKITGEVVKTHQLGWFTSYTLLVGDTKIEAYTPNKLPSTLYFETFLF